MVIIQFSGGLGNQIFQYAFSLNFRTKGIPVKYDLSLYERMRIHNGFELSRIFEGVKVQPAGKRDFFYFFESELTGPEKNYKLKTDKNIIREAASDEFKFQSSLAALTNGYFRGYWQNKDYFQDNVSLLREELVFRPLLPGDRLNNEVLSKILCSDSVGIHVRRGDYLLSGHHRVLDPEYYRKAIEIVSSRVENPVFFIFSDDIDWVKRKKLHPSAVYVAHNQGEKAYIDMQLMSCCKHNIIANSTFGWWAAWLNKHESKMVIAPQEWFNSPVDVSGMFAEDWVLI